MKELFDAAISAPNVIPTALLIFLLIYWLSVFLGALDISSFDVDVDTDVDLDVDADLDIDADADLDTDVGSGSGGASFNSVLAFFNIGKIPLMIFMSFLILPMWAISILLNDFFGNESFILGLIFLIPNFVVSLFIAKFITMPFMKLFANDEMGDADNSLIGKICIANSEITESKVGQARIETDGSPILLNIKTQQGTSLKVGESGLVIDYNHDNNVYLVEPYENI
ncbi:DUF1449 family protein [Fulvivirgaceae bacterium BMA10]|uniref:DUF1449 family protein n=1 Tax=Splendidivirga corallicola TaxID=3051826 RepID=A0ABT8KIR0_9BACT|nr:DUF1449 family protein [Fulvivirgaceae bacterium BMA10]